MAIKIIQTCPLGHKCEQAIDGAIERCIWYIPWTKPEKEPGRQCAMVSGVYMMEQIKNQTMGVQQAVESRGNETIERQDRFLEIVTSKRLNGGN